MDSRWQEVADGPSGVSTLRHYLEAVWRRKWLVLAPIVLVPLAVLVLTLRQDPVYEAFAEVLVNRQEAATTSVIGETPQLDDSSRTMDTHTELARVPTVLQRAVARAGESGPSAPEGLRAQSSVWSFADLLGFAVHDSDPERAQRLATAYAHAYVGYRRELDTAGLSRTLKDLGAQLRELEASGAHESPLYTTLADREQQLESLQALRTSNIAVVRTADDSSTTQVASRPRRNTAVAFAGSVIVGLLLVFLAESLGTRPRSKEETEALLEMPCLARVTFRDDSPRQPDASTDEKDAIRSLRAALDLRMEEAGIRSVLVSGLGSRDHAAVTAVELALVYASAGRNVALVDLDLRGRTMSTLLGLDDRIGIAEVIQGESELSEALAAVAPEREGRRASRADLNGRREAAGIEVLGAGRPIADPADLVSSKAVAVSLEELGRRADVVLVAAPPLLEGPDAASVAPAADGLLLVVGARDARGPDLAEARRAATTLPPAKLGFVLTSGEPRRSYGEADGVFHLRSSLAPDPERV